MLCILVRVRVVHLSSALAAAVLEIRNILEIPLSFETG